MNKMKTYRLGVKYPTKLFNKPYKGSFPNNKRNIPIITTQHIANTDKDADKKTIGKEKRFRNFRLVKVNPSQYSRNGE